MDSRMVVFEDLQISEVEETTTLTGEALKEVVNQWIIKGKDIHLRDVPYNIISAIYHHFNSSEWKDLACYLGVKHMQTLKEIEGDADAAKKWCSETLFEYCATHSQMTFGDLVNVLFYQLKRVYLVQSIHSSVEEFFIMREDPQWQTEYFRDNLNAASKLVVAIPSEHTSEGPSPRPPKRRALHSPQDVNKLQKNHSIDFEAVVQHLQDKNCIEKLLKVKPKPKKMVILLTYSEDANELVPHLVNELWKLKLGVVSEYVLKGKGFLETDFIATWETYFQESQFVVPIITQGYLNDIHQPTDELQSRGVRFVYDLYTRRYVQHGCLNHHVRPLMVDNVQLSMKNLNPTLQMRWKLWDDWQQFVQMIQTHPIYIKLKLQSTGITR